MTVSLEHYLVVSALLFSLGMLGVVTRRSLLIVYMSLELMLNSANLALVAFSRFNNNLDGQVIGINTPGPDDDWVIHDAGSGSAARMWDHRIYVESDGEGTRYSDCLRIDAGLLTPVVAAFAGVFSRYRQARWRRLVDNDFDYDR